MVLMKDKEFWNFCTLSYDFWHNLEYFSYKKAADNICQNISGEEKILEIACGTGILTKEITKRYKKLDYTATDYSEKMLEICARKKIKAKFELEDARNLPYEDNSFDIVIIANALHILPNPNIVLQEIKRVSKTGGGFILQTF